MRRDQQFRVALVSRDVIGQAKGRLMERFDIDAAEAFERLKQMSQDGNTPIAQVAQRVTRRRQLTCEVTLRRRIPLPYLTTHKF